MWHTWVRYEYRRLRDFIVGDLRRRNRMGKINMAGGRGVQGKFTVFPAEIRCDGVDWIQLTKYRIQ